MKTQPPPFLSKKTNTIFYISTEEEEDEEKKHEGGGGERGEIEHKGRDLLVWWRLKKCLKKFNRAEIGASGVQNGRYVWEKYYNYFGVGGKDEWDPHWLEDFCAGVTMATASSWLTKFVGAMAVNMVIVLLIREEECAFLCNIFIRLIIIIKDVAHILWFLKEYYVFSIS